MLDGPDAVQMISRQFDPFASIANRRQRALAALSLGIAGLAGDDDYADDYAADDIAPDQLPGTVQTANVAAAKIAKKKKPKNAKEARAMKKFAQQRLTLPGYSLTAGGLVRQKGGPTARAHIEDQLFNRGERLQRKVRDQSRDLADRMRERQAALFDAERARQAALLEAEKKVAEAQTATMLAQREAALFKQESEFARRVDPSEYEEVIDADATDAESFDADQGDYGDDYGDDYGADDEALEGTAGFFDFIKKIAPAAASFIPGVGPVVGTALQAVTSGKDNSKGAQVAAAIDPNAKLVATQTGAPSFEVQLRNVGQVLLDSLGRVIAKKTGGSYQPIATPVPVDQYAAQNRGAGNALPLLLLGGAALFLLARSRR